MNYEEKYKQALERARDLHDNHPLGEPPTWKTCEEIFPELRESEEEELTEFEKALDVFAYNSKLEASNPNYYDWLLKSTALNLLDLAKKEILKDLPKWKKAIEHKDLEKHIAILEEDKVLLSNYLEEGDYYIELEDLKTLSKEE